MNGLDERILSLLIDAAQRVDWYILSSATNYAGQRLIENPDSSLIQTTSNSNRPIPFDRRKYPSNVLTLKRLVRLNIRSHLKDLNSIGHDSIYRISSLTLPYILKKYLLYQEDASLEYLLN